MTYANAIPSNHHSLLRDVNLDGYRLQTFDTYVRDRRGGTYIGFRLWDPYGELLYVGEGEEGISPSPMHSIDSDHTLRAVLAFFDHDVTNIPGDHEILLLWSIEPEEGEDTAEFVDWERGLT